MNKKAKLKFHIATAVAYIIAVIAVLAAVFKNPPAQLGYGYLAGMNFLFIAVVIYTVCLILYNKRIKKSDLSDTVVYKLKRTAVSTSEIFYCMILVFGYVILPLKEGIDFTEDFAIYMWIYSVRDHLIPAMLLYWGFIALKYKLKNRNAKSVNNPKEHRLYHNIGVAVLCGICLSAAISLTDYISITVTNDLERLYYSVEFNDYESFKEFIETKVPYPEGEGIELDEDDPFYIENYRKTLKDTDGNVLIDYEKKNGSVYMIDYGDWTEGYLPIKVMTYEDKYKCDDVRLVIYRIFAVVSYLEMGLAIFVYIKKRMKKSDILSESENITETVQMIEKPME